MGGVSVCSKVLPHQWPKIIKIFFSLPFSSKEIIKTRRGDRAVISQVTEKEKCIMIPADKARETY